MKLSIVATLYRSATYINEFCTRAATVAQELVGDDYEIILVNDGSPDASLAIAVSAIETNQHIVVVDLSKNFGHHKAMMTGLAHAQGEHVFLIDSDLEEEPEWALPFRELLDREHADVVYGVQSRRKGNIAERLSGAAFFRLFRLLTGISQPDNIVTARYMTRRYVQALLLHQEREINIGGLWIITGFHQVPYVIQKHATSPTTYTFTRKLEHLINAVTSFSSLPLVFTFYTGLVISFTAVLYIIYSMVIRFLYPSMPVGFTALIASIWFFSGLIVFFLGIQGIYLSKIFTEVKQRPYTIVRMIYRHDNASRSSAAQD
ncbi:MAG: hypothetical protein RLY87_720 [Chloroflexota bacterium]|jgi:putative glycosyltransferase